MSNILNSINEASRSPEPDYTDPSWDEKVSNVGQKAKQAEVLKSKGKEPKTRWNPETKKYYVDFSDVDESVGLPYPGTYEETNDMFKSSGQRRIGTLTTEQGVAEGDDPFRGTGGAFNRGDDERHDLDPTDWYIVKDGKMFAASIYPRQVKQAIAQGFSRTKAEARANAGSQGVAEGSLEEVSQDTARSYAQKALASQKDLINQTHRKGADTDALNKKIKNRQQGMDRAHTDKRYYKDEQGVDEEKQRLDPKCWTGKHKEGTKMKGGVRVNNCVPNESSIMKGIKV